jgi:hypothetical protein
MTLVPRLFVALAGLILTLGLVACAPASSATPTPPPGGSTASAPASTFGQPIDGLGCDRGGHDGAYHIHAMLQLIVPGGTLTAPANVGINPAQCMYWVHTHDESGLIHIEAPTPIKPTLGDFLDIWTTTFPADARRLRFVRALETGRTEVNGQPLMTPWRDLILADNMTITVTQAGS